ncbi:MAG: hypothetical protein IKT08_01795 [Bacteroidales bacterium]|nr:hypothetical protein [Bacteroidales bacterium]
MKIKTLFIGVLLAVLFSGCGSEFWLANKFVVQSHRTRAAVYFPEEAQVTLIQNGDGTYTKVLDSLDQNAFLDIMYAAYADEMRTFGVDVYIPEDADHVPVDSTHWLVLLSKVEIQGLFTDYVDHLFDFTDDYDYSFSLNTVNVAAWFDINDGEWLPVTLYDECNLMDDFKSYVSNGNEGAQYHYDITPITTNDVYDYAVYLGKRYATFTYNYMMNRYVGGELKKKGDASRFKLRWDPYEESLYFLLEGEGFIELGIENGDVLNDAN